MSRLTLGCKRFLLAAGLLTAVAVPPAAAEELFGDRIELHGYGHQTFLLSNSAANGKYFKDADTHGSFLDNALALLFSFKATDDLSVWAQLYAGNESELRLDWAFADYQYGDWLRLRGGQIKTPLGLLNEVRDIKYIHLGAVEPAIYQETAGIMFESFRGASAVLEHEGGFGKVKLDLFGGAPVFFEGGEEGTKYYGLLGGRLSYETPLTGLTVGGTFASSRLQEAGEEGYERNTVAGGSLEYKHASVTLAGEYFQLHTPGHKRHGYYSELGYTLFDHLTPFVRYDYFTSDKEQRHDPGYYQKDVTVGVGYKFNNYVALKAENHFIKGFALPNMEYQEENEALPVPGPENLDGKKSWNLFAVSLNLMF